MNICRKLGVTETTFYRWKKQYTGLDVSELRELKQLREENRRLKGVVADLTLDKTMLREALEKKNEPTSASSGAGLGPSRVPDQRAACLPGPADSPRDDPRCLEARYLGYREVAVLTLTGIMLTFCAEHRACLCFSRVVYKRF